MPPLELNARALEIAEDLVPRAYDLRILVQTLDNGKRLIDCGIQATGSLEAGVLLAEICLAGLGRVSIATGPVVTIATDQPLAACMASQYAGWQLAAGKFFAMGSGPMRAAG